MSISILMQIKNDKVSIKTVKFSYYILFILRIHYDNSFNL